MRGNIVDHEHGVSGREQVVVQRAFFAASLPETPDDLYARRAQGVLERERERVVIQPHSGLSTNTFFGRFPTRYWQRWTDVTQVEFRVTAQGSGRISIRTLDIAGGASTLVTAVVENAQFEQEQLVVQVDTSTDSGELWLEAAAGAATLVLQSGYWRATFLVIDGDGESGRSKRETAAPGTVRVVG